MLQEAGPGLPRVDKIKVIAVRGEVTDDIIILSLVGYTCVRTLKPDHQNRVDQPRPCPEAKGARHGSRPRLHARGRV